MKQQENPQVYSREEYAKANFWDDRYSQKGGFFDWYAELPELKNAFNQYNIIPEDKILMVGCGNSKLSQQMYEAGYKDIINIDISPSVIEQMSKQFPHMVWEVMDATKMSYPDQYFDVILDKGTLDALISGRNYDICEAMLRDCMRVTKDTGQLILITYGSPEGRRKIFEGSLQFHKYDYYQCRTELNDMSTMINLMRANLGPRSLASIIKEKEIFAKTMQEFSLIKLMRRNRKNLKQYIIWSQHEKTALEVNTGYVKEKLEQKQQKQPNQNEQSEIFKSKQQGSKQQEKPEHLYKPKKQPYVYVYSVKRKFAQNFNQTVQKCEKIESQDNTYTGSNELQQFTVFSNEESREKIVSAVKFLTQKNISHSTIRISNKLQEALPKSVLLNLVSSNNLCKTFILRKTHISLSFALNPQSKVKDIFKMIERLPGILTTKASLFACPKTYALFSIIHKRENISINNLLQKYWFPTFKLISASQTQILYLASVPPLQSQNLNKLLKVFQQQLKTFKPKISLVRQGWISYIDLQILSIFSMACLSYHNAKSQAILQQFWEEDQISVEISKLPRIQNKLYREIVHTVILPKEIIGQSFTHLLALY